LSQSLECSALGGIGWIRHVQGTARLVQLRGPALHSSGLGHELFLRFRLNGVSLLLSDPSIIQHFLMVDDSDRQCPWKSKGYVPGGKGMDDFSMEEQCQVHSS
jgi:hypothetical protein